VCVTTLKIFVISIEVSVRMSFKIMRTYQMANGRRHIIKILDNYVLHRIIKKAIRDFKCKVSEWEEDLCQRLS
jgi:hypothetical protein